MSEPTGEHTITPDRAEAIASGEETFDTALPVVPITYVNKMLRVSVIIMAVVTLMTLLTLTVVVIFRSIERKNADQIIATGEQRIVQLNAQVEAGQIELRCRATSQVTVDKAQLELLITISQQFATALDRVPPAPDPTLLNAAADAARDALDQRQANIEKCAQTASVNDGYPPAPTTLPGEP